MTDVQNQSINNTVPRLSKHEQIVFFQSTRVQLITFNTTQHLHWLWQRNNLRFCVPTIQRTVHQIQSSTFKQNTAVHHTRQRHGLNVTFHTKQCANQHVIQYTYIYTTIMCNQHKCYFLFTTMHIQIIAHPHLSSSHLKHIRTCSFMTWQRFLHSVSNQYHSVGVLNWILLYKLLTNGTPPTQKRKNTHKKTTKQNKKDNNYSYDPLGKSPGRPHNSIWLSCRPIITPMAEKCRCLKSCAEV